MRGAGAGWLGAGMRFGTIWREQTGHQMESKGISTVAMVSGEGCRGRERAIASRAYNSTSLPDPASQRELVYYLFCSLGVCVPNAGDQISRAPIRFLRLIGRIRHRSDSHSLPTQ